MFFLGTVCSEGFDNVAAEVACQQLDFHTGTFTTDVTQGTGTIWLGNVDCKYGKSELSECRMSDWGVHECTHSQDIGLTCTSEECDASDQGNIRLVGGQSTDGDVTYSGRLEICNDEKWGA